MAASWGTAGSPTEKFTRNMLLSGKRMLCASFLESLNGGEVEWR